MTSVGVHLTGRERIDATGSTYEHDPSACWTTMHLGPDVEITVHRATPEQLELMAKTLSCHAADMRAAMARAGGGERVGELKPVDASGRSI